VTKTKKTTTKKIQGIDCIFIAYLYCSGEWNLLWGDLLWGDLL